LIHLDTSALVDALTGRRRSEPALRRLIADGERVAISTLALYEWLRGPRTEEEIEFQEALLPAAAAVPFGPEEAMVAAAAYRSLRARRGRAVDIAIGACAVTRQARLWTLNPGDVADIRDLELFAPA